jgi:dihydroorotase
LFNAPAAMESYAKVFDEEGALDRLEAFASLNGPAFYRLAPNEQRVALVRAPLEVPARIDTGAAEVVPFHAGATLGWRFEAQA